MSWEAWGDGDDGFDPEHLLNVGWWDPDKAKAVKGAIQSLHAEPVYEDGDKAKGISTRFLMRLTMLRYEAGLDVPQPLIDEARSVLGEEPSR